MLESKEISGSLRKRQWLSTILPLHPLSKLPPCWISSCIAHAIRWYPLLMSGTRAGMSRSDSAWNRSDGMTSDECKQPNGEQKGLRFFNFPFYDSSHFMPNMSRKGECTLSGGFYGNRPCVLNGTRRGVLCNSILLCGFHVRLESPWSVPTSMSSAQIAWTCGFVLTHSAQHAERR